jgi:hypothetical protein
MNIALHAVENVVRDGMSKTSTHQEQTVAAKVAVQGLSVDNNPAHGFMRRRNAMRQQIQQMQGYRQRILIQDLW